MTDASTPQNDRELLLKLNNEIQNLSISINGLAEAFKKLDEFKIGGLEKRVETLEGVWMQMRGGWKFALVVWTIVSATGIIGLIKWVIK